VNRGSGEESTEATAPRETTVLFGHGDAERELLAAYRSGRTAHAWLIGGESGIGKATLAYRMARFVLAYPDPSHPDVASATSLAVDSTHPSARLVAANAHPDLLTLERTEGESGKLRSVISVEQVRRLVTFFGSTAGEGGWRTCIVDSADELKYPEGSNALLKMLEEPPARTLFLLVSHAPGRLLPTIRSRCRRLVLKPLAQGEVARAVAAALGVEADSDRIKRAAAASAGSVARALALVEGPQLELRQRVVASLDALPVTNGAALHAIADQLDRTAGGLTAVFLDTVRSWLYHRLWCEIAPPQMTDRRPGKAEEDAVFPNIRAPSDTQVVLARLAPIADAWDRINCEARDAETYNLDGRPMVFALFSLLAEAARG
jgi:DNA polymerase III subunit delta'